MSVSTSPRAKPRSAFGGRAGLLRDLAIVALCLALVATFLSQLLQSRASEPPRDDPPAAAPGAR